LDDIQLFESVFITNLQTEVTRRGHDFHLKVIDTK
jgi:hypothetical protein